MDMATLLKELERDEGLRLRPYRDSLGYLTIGIGRCLDTAGITEAEARYMLTNDVVGVIAGLRENLPWMEDLPDCCQRALANMAFQMGLSGLLAFRQSLAELKAGRYQKAADMFLDSMWARQTPNRAKRVTDLIRSAA